MRITESTLLLLVLLYACNTIVTKPIEPEVILDYIEARINQNGNDPRLSYPPPPPELWDSLGKSGGRKPDSVIAKLKPLQIYIANAIKYDSVFEPFGVPTGYEFLNDVNNKRPKQVNLDISEIPTVTGIDLRAIDRDDFFEIYESIRLDDEYEGLVRFHNLFYSENGNKAYFEIIVFVAGLDGSVRAVYAEFINGEWEFKIVPVSIS
jgi:hypothetical protein